MNKRWLLLAVTVLIGVFVMVILTQTKHSPTTIVTPSGSPSVSPDENEAQRVASKLATAYTTYTLPNDPAYYASIKPYVSDEVFRQVVTTNEKAATGAEFIHAVQSDVKKTTVESHEGNNIVYSILVESREPKGGKQYEQTVHIVLQRKASKWEATAVGTVSSTRQEDYLNG